VLFWIGVILASVVGVIAALLLWAHIAILRHYLQFVLRIFQEKPLFIIPFGQPEPDAEHLEIPTPDGIKLQGCYLRSKQQPRRGVIYFGLEFGSNRWSCGPYCDFLREAGYDIFACETRGQGQTPAHPGYEPLQWVTTFDVDDCKTALEYLKSRSDADPRGIGHFGLSKGGAAGVLASALDPYVRCFVTDGAFGTLTTMIPYMAQWVMIYTPRKRLAKYLPKWYLRHIAKIALKQIEEIRNVKYPSLVRALRVLAPRPILMIHGGGDNYIKPDMARSLFDNAKEPKELWIVEKAKHNQAYQVAGDDYRRRIVEFFDKNLAAQESGVRDQLSGVLAPQS
jgi:pimeloyl-ACP methyl ester carboxylesterase